MEVIEKREGKRKGETGVTIHMYKQRTRPMVTKTITVHGIDIESLYTKMVFFLKAFSKEGNYEITAEVD